MGEHEKTTTDTGLTNEGDELLRKIFNYSYDAIFVIDPECDQIIEVNPRTCTLLGYSRDELLPTPISAIYPREMARFLAFAKSVFEEGHGWINELSCITKPGSDIPAEISASVIETADGKCLIAFVRDISERKRLEEKLRRYSAILEALVAERTERLRRSEERQRVLLEINNALIAKLDRESLFPRDREDPPSDCPLRRGGYMSQRPGKRSFSPFCSGDLFAGRVRVWSRQRIRAPG